MQVTIIKKSLFRSADQEKNTPELWQVEYSFPSPTTDDPAALGKVSSIMTADELSALQGA
jgi:hypothetical protein